MTHPFGLKQWQCTCGTTNLEIRKKCRTCGKTELAALVAKKREEIGDKCQWEYRKLEDGDEEQAKRKQIREDNMIGEAGI